jgi:hypothetical protein
MNVIRSIFDVATGEITLVNEAGPFWCDVVAELNRHGQTIDIDGLSFGATVTINDETALSIALPPPGVRYRSTDQDVLAVARVQPFPPDAECVVSVWVRTGDGREYQAETAFTIPRPAQPFPSWTWTGTAWQAPEPYPDDGEMYQWDEDAGDWVPYDEPA